MIGILLRDTTFGAAKEGVVMGNSPEEQIR